MDALAHRSLNLTQNQMKVVARHFLGRPQLQIARDLRMTQPAVSQHLAAARRRNPELFAALTPVKDHRRRRVCTFSQLPPDRLRAFAAVLGLN